MIKGIGIDITEISRIDEILEKQPKIIERVLRREEIDMFEQINSDTRKVEWLAGRFAAKEAFSKAYGTGIGKEVSFQDMLVSNDESGRPFITYKNENLKIHLSISHSRDYAVAQVVIEDLE